MNQRKSYLTQIKQNLKKCDEIVSKLDERGYETAQSKILLSDLEQDLNELNGKDRMRYSLDAFIDCCELSEFYLDSLKNRKRII